MRVCIIALSDVTVDPRPRRHADLLTERGVAVVVVGYPPSRRDAWEYVPVDPPFWSAMVKAKHFARLGVTRLLPSTSERFYWRSPGTQRLLAAVRAVEADLYVSHDLYALPVAARVAAERDARYAYEAREFYVGQHADRASWRLLWPSYANALQGRLVHDAAWVTTVSEGLADWLTTTYSMATRPTVVRSIPALRQTPHDHEPTDQWTVLFHGSLRPDRNVHGLIESVPLWDRHLRLVIRGNGAPEYLKHLNETVASGAVSHRVSLEPGVPVDEVIGAAAGADIGVIPWPLNLPQKRFALPNKLFEYLAAGLAVVQTGPSESARLVAEARAGSDYSPATPQALAACLNSLTRDQLLAYRASARALRDTLTWERERERLWTLYEPFTGSPSREH